MDKHNHDTKDNRSVSPATEAKTSSITETLCDKYLMGTFTGFGDLMWLKYQYSRSLSMQLTPRQHGLSSAYTKSPAQVLEAEEKSLSRARMHEAGKGLHAAGEWFASPDPVLTTVAVTLNRP